MIQISFSDAEQAGKRKKTRREVFLAEMRRRRPGDCTVGLLPLPSAAEYPRIDLLGFLEVAVSDGLAGRAGRLHRLTPRSRLQQRVGLAAAPNPLQPLSAAGDSPLVGDPVHQSDHDSQRVERHSKSINAVRARIILAALAKALKLRINLSNTQVFAHANSFTQPSRHPPCDATYCRAAGGGKRGVCSTGL